MLDKTEWDRLVSEEKARFTYLSWNDFIDMLPAILPEEIDLCVTGGLSLNGFTEHDIDFYMEGDSDVLHMNPAIHAVFFPIFNKHVHVGNQIYPARPSPVVIQLYDSGILRDRDILKSLVITKSSKTPQENGYIAELNERISIIEGILKKEGLY